MRLAHLALLTCAACSFTRPKEIVGDADPAPDGHKYVLAVTKTGDADGRVTATVGGEPAAIDCGTECSEEIEAGTVIQLHAEPASGASFVGWGGACSGNDCTLTLLSETTITADFRTNKCTPNTTTCSNDATIVCDSTGHPTFTDCRNFGCWDSAGGVAGDTGDRCADLDPSNGLASFLDMAMPDSMNLSDGATINTDTGVIVDNGLAVMPQSFVVAQAGTAVEIRAFTAKNLVLRNTTVSGARALAFVVDGSVQVLGQVALAADHSTKAAGSTSDPTRCDAGLGTWDDYAPGIATGAGGGGYATAGGDGGAMPSNGLTAAVGGSAIDSNLQPLVGGCSGGANAAAGGGGGAIQLVSRTSITVAVMGGSIGKIHVGGGGAPALDIPYSTVGGGGGGSGGSVLLEAPLIVLSGTGAIIAANGGGGGGTLCNNGGSGQNASASTVPAAGGVACSGNDHYLEGAQGATGTSPAFSAPGFSSGGFMAYGATGGGGGGLGYLVIRNTLGTFAPQDGAVVSAALKQAPLQKRARL
jgi:hypothetical protein